MYQVEPSASVSSTSKVRIAGFEVLKSFKGMFTHQRIAVISAHIYFPQLSDKLRRKDGFYLFKRQFRQRKQFIGNAAFFGTGAHGASGIALRGYF